MTLYHDRKRETSLRRSLGRHSVECCWCLYADWCLGRRQFCSMKARLVFQPASSWRRDSRLVCSSWYQTCLISSAMATRQLASERTESIPIEGMNCTMYCQYMVDVQEETVSVCQLAVGRVHASSIETNWSPIERCQQSTARTGQRLLAQVHALSGWTVARWLPHCFDLRIKEVMQLLGRERGLRSL